MTDPAASTDPKPGPPSAGVASEGYVVLALDDPRYLDLAANLALSLRRHDTRPVTVIINPQIPCPAAYKQLFSQVVTAQDDRAIRGAMNKARLFDLSPYDRTLYLDADCLLFSPRIEFFWRKYRGHPFAVEGHQQASGAVFACSLGEKDAAALCALLSLPFVAVFNAGVIYFERSPAGRAVFDKARALYAGPHRDAISYPYKHAGEYADEPFFGAAMGALGIAPFEPPATQRLQVTTPNLIEAVLDIDTGDLRVVKRGLDGKPRLWSGVVCHFCGLSPMDGYFAIADRLRTEAGLPAMDRGRFTPVVMTAAHHAENDPGT
jgi:hypothetical protein